MRHLLYNFSEQEQAKLEKMGDFKWENAVGMNLRETLNIELKGGETACIEVDRLSDMRRTACCYCKDYSAEFADLSFGGVGAPSSWTTAIIRTPVGRAAFTDAVGKTVVEFQLEENPRFAQTALDKILTQSDRKKEKARKKGEQAARVHHLYQ